MLPVVMSIAGSDSGGGAGIQADLKTFHAFGCFGTTAITAITCQNTTGVSDIQGIRPEIVSAQIADVLADFPVKAAKTGMLLSADIMKAVEEVWKEKANEIPLVIDPVMVASSGARLLEKSAEEALIRFIQNAGAALITPNLPEAGILYGRRIETVEEAVLAAKSIGETSQSAVLIKGGHRLASSGNDEVIDILYDPASESHELITGPRLSSTNTHGTGCTLSAAITAGLGHGNPLAVAVKKGRDYLVDAMKNAPGFGKGFGPLNHVRETWKIN